jgi:hypothetical protein
MRTKYKMWSKQEITEIRAISHLDKSAIRQYAKQTNRTYNSVYAAIRRHMPKQQIAKQQVTKVKKSSTVVFNNYKSVIVEANSILIEF